MRGLLRRLQKRLRSLYAWLYAQLCGTLPNVRPWHYQWSATHSLNTDLRAALPLLEGRVLMVGDSPYRALCSGATSFFGVDESPGAAVDLVIQPNQPWPLPAAAFDAAYCIQTLGRAAAPEQMVAELARVLRPGAVAVFSAATLGATPDLRRYTAEGLRRLLGAHFTVTSIRRQGGIGSTLALLSLGWVQALAQESRIVRLLLAVFLPFWIAFCGALNWMGLLLDTIDPTQAFYTNVLVVAVRRGEATAHASEPGVTASASIAGVSER